MDYKNISSKFTLQTQKKYVKIPKYKLAYKDSYHEIFLFSHPSKIYSAKVSYCQHSDIREVSIALVW